MNDRPTLAENRTQPYPVVVRNARLTPKQQKFVDGVIAGKTNTQAYLDAYGGQEVAAAANASRLIRNDRIVTELARRQAKVAVRSELTAARHSANLKALRDEARGEKQFAAAITAEISRGKLAGFYVDKTEDVTKLTPEEREAKMGEFLKRRGLKLEKTG